jgi:hypothetical protein
MEQALAMVVLVSIGIGALLFVQDGTARAAQAATERAAAVRQARREAADRVFALAKANIQAGHPLGALGWLPPDAKVSITTPPIRESALPASVLAAPPISTEAPPLQLPGVMTLGQVVGYHPTRDRILLGLGPGGVLHTVSIEELLHLLIVGRTGGGKSVIERLVMTCLGAIPDVELHWWNPHYTPRDPDTGDEWDLIAARCVGGRALTDEGEILAALERMARVDLPARKARYRVGAHPGPPRFYVIDEAPVLAAADKRFMPWLGAVLREGRKFGLYIIMATQDALISTLGGSSGLRAQAQTVYYVGGDSYSAKALLGFVPPDPEGRGICHLKSTATPSSPLIRVPRPTNADVRAWLGPLVNAVSPVSETVSPVSPARFTVLRSETDNSVLEAVPETTRIDPLKRAAALVEARATRMPVWKCGPSCET